MASQPAPSKSKRSAQSTRKTQRPNSRPNQHPDQRRDLRQEVPHQKPKRRWVVKAGSQMVCAGGPILLRAWMSQVAELKKRHNVEVVWVTSGAIASAIDRTNFKPRNNEKRSLPEKQALSAIGQPMVMDLYNLALNANGLLGAQVLLTAGDMRDAKRRANLQNSLNTLLEWQAVPILNENDAVATDEIQFGDNDSLSAQIAEMIHAEKLILLTDVDGLFDSDPKINNRAKIIGEVESIPTTLLKQLSVATKSSRGTGGMYSKLIAAKRASAAGIVTHLVRGDHPGNLLAIFENQKIGTRILTKPKAQAKLPAKSLVKSPVKLQSRPRSRRR